MNYVSNRNYGCRLKEVLLNGHRILILENDRISLLILLDKGADIIEFNYKKTDTEFLWRSPSGLDLLSQNKTENKYYVGGWFEAFPNVGHECMVGGEKMPFYGDAHLIPWEYTILKDEPEEMRLRLFVRSMTLPLSLERTMTLKIGDSTLYLEETAGNLSRCEIGFTWGHHPNIGAPFLNEECIIDLPDCDLFEFVRDEEGVDKEVLRGSWPYMDINGVRTDLRSIPAASEWDNSLVWLKNMKESRAAVINPKTRLGIEFRWDGEVFKHLLLWKGFDAKKWSPVFGHLYLVCFLIKSCSYSPLSEAIRYRDLIVLKPGETISTWLTAGIVDNS